MDPCLCRKLCSSAPSLLATAPAALPAGICIFPPHPLRARSSALRALSRSFGLPNIPQSAAPASRWATRDLSVSPTWATAAASESCAPPRGVSAILGVPVMKTDGTNETAACTSFNRFLVSRSSASFFAIPSTCHACWSMFTAHFLRTCDSLICTSPFTLKALHAHYLQPCKIPTSTLITCNSEKYHLDAHDPDISRLDSRRYELQRLSRLARSDGAALRRMRHNLHTPKFLIL